MKNIKRYIKLCRGGKIKGKLLFLACLLIITSITVAAYPATCTNFQSGQFSPGNNYKTGTPNKLSAGSLTNTSNSRATKRSGTSQYKTSRINVKASRSQSIARKYIEEPGAVAGKPKRHSVCGTDIVPVLLNGKRVGEIDIDPKTGKNVGGAGGAP